MGYNDAVAYDPSGRVRRGHPPALRAGRSLSPCVHTLARPYDSLMPDRRTTSPQRTYSAAMKSRNCWGDEPIGSTPLA